MATEEVKTTTPQFDYFSGMSPWTKIGMVLAQGAAAFGEGLTGRPFGSNLMEMQNNRAKMAYETWKQKRAIEAYNNASSQSGTVPTIKVPDPSSPIGFRTEIDPTYKGKIENQIAESKPMPAESALRYSGALQGIRGIKEIVKKLGLGNENFNIKEAKDLIYKTNLAIEGTGAKPTIIPGGQGIYRGIKMIRGGDEGSELASYFMTTAENILRARTGAAAPDPEIVREYSRSLLKSFIESPETWKSKLGQVEEFLAGTAKGIKPSSWEKDLAEYKSTTFNDGQTATNKKTGEKMIFRGGKWQKIN